MNDKLGWDRSSSLRLLAAALLLAASANALYAFDSSDTPKTDAPKTDASKTESPKTDAPKTESPKTEAPKTEAPKTDAPKADAPKADAPKTQPKASPAPKRIKQADDGSVVLDARDVVIHGTTVRYEPAKNTIGYWTKQADWVSWDLEIAQPGAFTVEMNEGCGTGSGGSHYTVEIADRKLTDIVRDTGSFQNFRFRKIGEVKIDKPGNYTLSVHVSEKSGLAVMDLRTVTLSPPKPDKAAPSKPGP